MEILASNTLMKMYEYEYIKIHEMISRDVFKLSIFNLAIIPRQLDKEYMAMSGSSVKTYRNFSERSEYNDVDSGLRKMQKNVCCVTILASLGEVRGR